MMTFSDKVLLEKNNEGHGGLISNVENQLN